MLHLWKTPNLASQDMFVEANLHTSLAVGALQLPIWLTKTLPTRPTTRFESGFAVPRSTKASCNISLNSLKPPALNKCHPT